MNFCRSPFPVTFLKEFSPRSISIPSGQLTVAMEDGGDGTSLLRRYKTSLLALSVSYTKLSQLANGLFVFSTKVSTSLKKSQLTTGLLEKEFSSSVLRIQFVSLNSSALKERSSNASLSSKAMSFGKMSSLSDS